MNSTADAKEMVTRDHVVIFPFMAKGHTVPLLHLAAALSDGGADVTLVTTTGNEAFFRSSLPSDDHPNVRFVALSFPLSPPLPPGCESTDHLPSPDLFPAFVAAAALLRDPFHGLLRGLCRDSAPAPPPLCLISDFFLGWTLPICQSLAVPRVVFHGMGAFSMALSKSLWAHHPHASVTGDREPFPVPGAPPHFRLTLAEVPDTIRDCGDRDNPVTQFLEETGASDVNSWGVLVNSFAELEKDYVETFESFYRANGGGRAWLVGPLSLLPRAAKKSVEESENGCLRWLDGRGRGSVVYVSFGTQAHVTDGQLDEVAHGLADAGCDFLWAVRSPSWAPPEEAELRWEGRGRVERGWVPQGKVLEHMAVGGFVSHCGWNSVLESVAAGVPVLAWPMMAEQGLNAKLVVEELGMGVGLKVGAEKRVSREDLCEGVRELMGGGGEKGSRARERAADLQAASASAVADGGSSRRKLEELIQELRLFQRVNRNSGEGLVSEGLQLEWQDAIQTT